MNRTIKFKIWDLVGEKWIPWEFGYGLPNFGEDIVLLQYTGFLDKNGKEIYEGDIVTLPQEQAEIFGIEESKGEVYFTRGCFYVAKDSSASLTNLALYTGEYKGEIIGNIYEHSELLKK